MTIDFESDAQLDALSADKLSLVSKLALQQQGLELQIAETEAALKRLQAQLRTVTEEQLPEAMAELGITELVLSDGSHITVVNEYYASIPRAMEQRAFRWLADRNFDSLLKHSFTLQFGRGEKERADEFRCLIGANAYEANEKMAVHPQTLKAFVREQAEAGTPVPEDLFGVYVINRAKIRR